jgi:superfamily II DNA or RNA helicase
MDEVHVRKLQAEITGLEQRLADKKRQLEEALCAASISGPPSQPCLGSPESQGVNNHSSPEDKITLFRSLFRGREDVYARRFESKKTGKSGYQPCCRNEWVRGLCEKPRTSCGSCGNRNFEPVTDRVIRNHLAGFIPAPFEGGPPLPFVMGVYPLLQNETCYFLAVDFDKQSWQEDVKAFMETCRIEDIPASPERSRSGNGAHIWIFFENAVPAVKARKLGSFLMTRTLDRRPEIGLDSFDRFFPNQDTLLRGGFGNLIALPLQKAAREKNHSIFLNDNLAPYPDQWAYLSSVKKVDEKKLDSLIRGAAERRELLPVAWQSDNTFEHGETEDEDKPWQRKAESLPLIAEQLPSAVEVVISDQIYVNHTGLPPVLRNRLLRLASFSNPEFYRTQAMRLPTWNKPRILCCYEFFPKYIGLPVGCFDSIKTILEYYSITPQITDEQNHGRRTSLEFHGELRDEQKKAAEAILANPDGILSASTAFGKTVIALWVVAERKVNTVILVHRKQLMDQWTQRISRFLGIPKKEIGCVGGGKKNRTGIIDIAMMQSVGKRNKSNQGFVEDWIKDYGQVIVDECHHISASSFERIVRNCPAYYRLGLSATVIRKDGQHPIVFMNFGPVRYSSRHNAESALFAQKVIPRLTAFMMPEFSGGTSPPVIHDVFHQLWTDKERNTFIVNDIVTAYGEGRECLVLSERLEHLAMLREQLQDRVDNLFMLTGGMGKKQYRAVMESINAVPEDANRVILATGKYLGEGFDLPCLDTLFLVFPFSWKGTLIQYAGRLNRTCYGKTEIRVYDYVDEKVPVLLRMYGRRLKGYASLGFVTG